MLIINGKKGKVLVRRFRTGRPLRPEADQDVEGVNAVIFVDLTASAARELCPFSMSPTMSRRTGLTPAMQEFTLDQLANVIRHETAGITRAQLVRLADELPIQPYVTLEDLEPSDQDKLSDDGRSARR